MPITLISDAMTQSTLTHEGGISVEEFERRCVQRYTCVRVLASTLTPEIDYGLFRPSNVCQACFCRGRVCYNFRPRSADNSGVWCDQCRVHKRPGCSKVNYEKVSKGQVPLAHLWLLKRSHIVSELEIPEWYLVRVLDSRENKKPMARVCNLNELRIGVEVESNHIPPVLPSFRYGKITNYGTFGSSSADIPMGFMISTLDDGQTQVSDNNEDNESSAPIRRSRRLARAGVRRRFVESEEENDELESDVGGNEGQEEDQIGSGESDYQWHIEDLPPVDTIRSPSPRTRNQVRGDTPPAPLVPISVGEIPQSNFSSLSQESGQSLPPINSTPPSQELPPFVMPLNQVTNQDQEGYPQGSRFQSFLVLPPANRPYRVRVLGPTEFVVVPL